MLDVILSAELLFEAIETAVGNSDTTSFAKLGPDKLTYLLEPALILQQIFHLQTLKI